MYPCRITKLQHRGLGSLSGVSKIMLVKYNTLGRTISGIFPHHFLNVYLDGGMENFERIKTKRIISHKYQEHDLWWNVGFSAAKVNFQTMASPQFWSAGAHFNSECPILGQNLQLLEEDENERNFNYLFIVCFLLVCLWELRVWKASVVKGYRLVWTEK